MTYFIVFLLFSLITSVSLLRKDLFFGFYYSALILYIIVTQFAYIFFPDLLVIYGFDGDLKIFEEYFWFVLISLVLIYLGLNQAAKQIKRKGHVYSVLYRVDNTRLVLFIFLIGFLMTLLIYLFYQSGVSGYGQSDDYISLSEVLYKRIYLVIFALYAAYRTLKKSYYRLFVL